ncbi:Beta-barrel assembly machine subunit BamD [Flammeovirgaceae bacterium 311]|nr:Beta-barrel assembly machine subunit BamD [Flammeovirgaceae bacterium 311]
MRLSKINLSIFGFLLILVLGSCNRGFNRLQRSEDPMVKYEAALKYYEEEKYARTAILLEDIRPILTGRPEGEKAQFIYAYSHFHQKLYIESAYYFNEFYNIYGRSPLAEEALFMHGYSLYLQSPRYNLDQTSTLEAVTALQNFINQHPNSEYKDRATKILDELQFKLANKAFDNAKLFYEVGRYKSALVVLDTFADDFPDSEHNEEAAYLRIQAAYELARNSLPSKQAERYRDVVNVYLGFIDRYPESKFLSNAERLYITSQAELEKISSTSTANNNL